MGVRPLHEIVVVLHAKAAVAVAVAAVIVWAGVASQRGFLGAGGHWASGKDERVGRRDGERGGGNAQRAHLLCL